MNLQQWYDFITDVGDHFLEAYCQLYKKEKTCHTPLLNANGKKLEGAAMWSLTWFMTKGPSLVLRPMEELKVF